MTSRQIVKAWMPPAPVAWFRPVACSGSATQNWRGIYTRFGDVPVVDPFFDDKLINHMACDTEATLTLCRAGEGPTFVAEQINVPGQVLPHWFINAGEISAILAGEGYRLVCDELTARVFDQSAFPESHRVERFRDMLFVRETRHHVN